MRIQAEMKMGMGMGTVEDGVAIFVDMSLHCGGGSGAGGTYRHFGSRKRRRWLCGF